MKHEIKHIIEGFKDLIEADQNTQLRGNTFVYDAPFDLQAANLNKGVLEYENSTYTYKRNWSKRNQKKGFDFPLVCLAPFDFTDSDAFGQNPVREYNCRLWCLMDSSTGKVEDLINDAELLLRRYCKAFIERKKALRNVDNCAPFYDLDNVQGYSKVEYALGGVLGVGCIYSFSIKVQLDYEQGQFKF